MIWFIMALRKFGVFRGRARRKEFWFFVLFSNLFIYLFAVLVTGLGLVKDITIGIFGLLLLALIIPTIAVTVRRLHDTGRSGWWLLIYLVPIIGPIIALVFLASDGQPGPNKFGLDPKQDSGPMLEPLSDV